MGQADLIPAFKFDGASLGSSHCFDAWRETIRCVYDVAPLEEAATEFENVDGWLVNSLIFSEVSFSRQSFRHHARHLQDANYLSVQIYRSGGARGVLADQSWIMKPGDVHIHDFSREFRSVTEKSVVSGVTIPHADVGYDPATQPAHMMFCGDSAIGSVLRESFYAIQRRLPELNKEEAAVLANGFCGLVRGVISPQKTKELSRAKAFSAERRVAMRSYLDKHLSDPGLGIHNLLNTFGVSRPSIYRDFGDVGGVTAYINERRLNRAFHQLISANPSHGRVKEIAHHIGFKDTSYFNKLFRKRFGITPRAAMTGRQIVRAYSQQSNQIASSPNTSQLNDWFNSI
ncbi:helix-turn-helix transcriptional regulator [Hoeflea prorocentri]|uniref:AraC family transcriptional regulator n=1 Tax=Hoeflea prorocentri TaxID=1922333 RepID=A0A9X3UI92_9HYPH|nr:AraC family transcriptional regulator [Hoeflea prorocentri]MCY6381888.1 AraC family transcriptional regulator [Hoeflea prorocentri]MDA5399688.1 AraC family transcriptional regulator [Hoeflea prorocentri]